MSDPQRRIDSPQHGRGPMVVRLGPVRSAQELIQPVQPPQQPKPSRPRRRSRLVGVLSAVMTILAVGGIVVLGGGLIAQKQLQAEGPLQSDKVVSIPKNAGLDEITEILTREGVINQPGLFMVRAQLERFLQPGHHLRAGEYQFKQLASVNSVIDTLTSGHAITHAVTIPEGLTSQQVVDKINGYDFLTGNILDVPIEGSLLPTTLRFERGTSRQSVIDNLRREEQKTLKDVWAKRAPDLPLKTPQELVTLASIVEKETSRADERPRIAAVFLNRLARNMKLQSDPTTIYGLVGGKGVLGRPLTRADLEKPTAYNTYVITGLPPGPIANPGRAALEAVANPSRTKELYFVADGTGGHAFADSLDQHNKNVQRWRQLEQQKEQAAPAAPAPVPAPAEPAKSDPQQKTEWQPLTPLPPQRQVAAQPAPPAAMKTATATLPAGASGYAMPSLEVTGLEDLLGADGAAAAGSSRNARPASSDVTESVDSWPVPARMKARIDKAAQDDALAGGNSTIAAGAPPALPAAVATASPAGATALRRPVAFDAVAGTKLDPLNNHSYDLSSAKTVPTLR